VREFAVRLEAPVEKVLERCAGEGVNAGYALGASYPEFGNGLLIAMTERRSRKDIDRLVEVLGSAVAAERTPAEEAVGA
jgi:glycine dehydrogenase subunit 1